MRLVSYVKDGVEGFGAVLGEDGLVELGPAMAGSARDLRELLAQDLLDEARRLVAGAQTSVRLQDVILLPVIPNPARILCVGLNYAEHVREANRQVTEQPTLFLRLPQSQAAHGQDILLPLESSQLDYEGEIAVVIGKAGRRIAESDAMAHVAGYACYNDASVRDWQAATTQWTAGKNFPATGAFGPWLLTTDEVDGVMTLVTRVNGQEVQRATTAQMIHGIARQIAHASAFTTLEPGDVIVTGTPGGVGMKRTPPLWLRDGDIVEVEVDAIGVLRNRVRAETSSVS
jgi:2-keto-4-pentenoate hydratase/2-oxohepta-3-ene-1,7-dioic acid hydratase in catechol pathway